MLRMPDAGLPTPPGAIFLTLIPSLLPYGFACLAWSVICLVMLMVTVYWWAGLLLKDEPTLPQLASFTIIAAIAPVIWSFWCHQLTIPTLFFATLAIQQWAGRNSLKSGLAAGLMLIKPHLTLFLAIWLLLRAPRKLLFLAGLLITLGLPFLPFYTGYRPASDLKDLARSIKLHSVQLFCQDDQNLVANAYWSSLTPKVRHEWLSYNHTGRINFTVPIDVIRPLNQIKMTVLTLALCVWTVYLLRAKESSPTVAAVGLGLGVLAGPYSHLYDGVVVMPLIMAGVYRCGGIERLYDWACLMFFANAALASLPLMDFTSNVIPWFRVRPIAMVYFFAGAAMLLWGARRKHNIVVTFA